MPKFRFECIDDDNVVTTKTFEPAYLQECVEQSQDFLHGCGFVFDELSYTKSKLSPEEEDEASKEDSKVLLQEVMFGKTLDKSTITDWTATD